MSNLTRIFVYGTLKTGQPNNKLMWDKSIGEAQLVAKGITVDSWPLVIASKYNIPYLIYCKGMGKRVVGEVYDVDQASLKFLDDFEGYPKYYDRILINVEDTKSPSIVYNCYVYILKDYKPFMLSLPMYEDYDSCGEHGLRYVESEKTSSVDEIDDNTRHT